MLGGKGFLVIGYLLEKVCFEFVWVFSVVFFVLLLLLVFVCISPVTVIFSTAYFKGLIEYICDIRSFWFVILKSSLQKSSSFVSSSMAIFKESFFVVDHVCLIYAFTLDLLVNYFNAFSVVFFHPLFPKLSFMKVLLFPVCAVISWMCHNLGLNLCVCMR